MTNIRATGATSNTNRVKTVDAAKGKWRSILSAFGVQKSFLTGKHGPCPLCQGRDRFRFDDKEGKGTYFCSGCGAGTGMDLLQKFKGWDFKYAAAEVDKIVGNVKADKIKTSLDDETRLRLLRDLWSGSRPVRDGDQVSLYLASRGLSLPNDASCLRYAEKCEAPFACGGGYHPAMIAMIRDAMGDPATLHRTFLGDKGKAQIADPRATMPGGIPDGSAIRLTSVADELGIAEGIETALAAAALFKVPTWAAINSTMLAKWQPPPETKSVVVYGDNDEKFGGAAAAYALAHRLTARLKLKVRVMIPDAVGMDWADVLAEGKNRD